MDDAAPERIEAPEKIVANGSPNSE